MGKLLSSTLNCCDCCTSKFNLLSSKSKISDGMPDISEMRSLKASGGIIWSPDSSPIRSPKPGKEEPPLTASLARAAAHSSRSTNSELDGSCLHSTLLADVVVDDDGD